MSAESQVFEMAASMGVTVAAGGGGWFEVLLEAPAGTRWEGDAHELVVAGYPGEPPAPVWRRALACLRSSRFVPCDDPACEWCGRET